MTPEAILDLIKEKGIEFVDVKFNDLPGLWQHFSVPANQLDLDTFKEGLGFDGSSIRGFQAIQESDMILFPDPSSAFMDPACKAPTLSIICDIYDPINRVPYTRDPRYVAKKS
jgi:L-glutamine synthetase (EC 6.3.1.2)